MESVAAFTDTYLPTVNGVTYTVQGWRDRWEQRGGRMDVVYPGAPDRDPEPGEHPVRSLPLPIYAGYRLGLPRVPDAVTDVDIVHAHTPFSLGLAGFRLARSQDLPLVATYHTPASEYATYLSSWAPIRKRTAALSRRYESWFLGQADAVIVPSENTGQYVAEELGVDDPRVVPNGVDTERFRPVDPSGFRERHDLPEDRTLVGYTGRHGHEKSLPEILVACDRLDREVTVVFGGDGPAREELEAAARARNVDARFLGFLDREELPAFYASLDAFLFPSPVETQGLVALESFACGTPVVAVDSGALSDTVDDGETGYHFPEGDVDAFAGAIARTLDDRERLSANCLDKREAISVEHAVDLLAEIYADVRA
ncbi:glycosyltransferase [Halolamina salifodinae]|uniref:Glycosyltransferase involved in cell wall biosynthesis n=1 Tax=Halolamina salifodinae TaxID=1202767 RepID=A0A8T4GYS9_9EURY|nr:glycosyltransferase [Halolamina salifodinae]MBP1987422.1 glycosyltransferase involved in cell wall biosynthesis [Halolamina salifodinae]